jgi:hypothetical protein
VAARSNTTEASERFKIADTAWRSWTGLTNTEVKRVAIRKEIACESCLCWRCC